MPTATRCLFRCTKFAPNSYSGTDAEFTAQYDDKTPRDQQYAQATPSGDVKFNVTNPNVKFEVGKQYYFDITPADG